MASGYSVVATRRACDGFETFMDVFGVTDAYDAHQFRSALGDVLFGDSSGTARAPAAMVGLLWEEDLKPMVRASEALAAGQWR